MIHSFEGDALVVPADRPKQVQGHVRVDGVEGRLLGARVFLDADHTDPTDLRVSLGVPDGGVDVLVNRSAHPNGGYTVPKRLLDTSAGPNGPWTLLVQDLVARDGGRVSWRLELETTAGGYWVDLDLDETLRSTSVYRAAFEQAAARMAEIIVGALPPVTLPDGTHVENLLIHARAVNIDGVGGTLGAAGATHIRNDSLLPIAGLMRFDLADLARMADDGSLFNVIVHEMFHVGGVGTIWKMKGLVHGSGGSNPVFAGPLAHREYIEWSGNVDGDGVPVENTGGAGTRESHWREAAFDTELMTGWIDRGFNPLSRITVASLADLGYEVDMHAADDLGAMARSLGASRGGVPRRCACTRFVPQRVAA